MKSHRTRRAWTISLLVHLCLAVALAYITINHEYPSEQAAISVSILKVSPIPVTQRKPQVEMPVVVPAPVPDFKVTPQPTLTQTRSVTAHQVRPTVQSTPSSAPPAVDNRISQPRTQAATVSLSSPVNHPSTQPLATIADLPVQSDTPLVAGLSGSGSLADGIGEGEGGGLGSGVGRGTLGSGGGIDQTPTRNSVGLTSLVTAKGTAHIDTSLAEVAQNIVLGNGVRELPKGTPGAIVQGRGREIIGRLNLVRFEDPLHPSGDV